MADYDFIMYTVTDAEGEQGIFVESHDAWVCVNCVFPDGECAEFEGKAKRLLHWAATHDFEASEEFYTIEQLRWLEFVCDKAEGVLDLNALEKEFDAR